MILADINRAWVRALLLLAATCISCAGCKDDSKEDAWPPYLMDIEFEVTFRDTFTKEPIPNMVVGYDALNSIADPRIEPKSIFVTDENGSIFGRDTMSIFQGLGFWAPLLAYINGYDNLTNEGWLKIIQTLQSGELGHRRNQERYCSFSENALVDSNRNDNYVRYKKDVFIDPNGLIRLHADWLPDNEYLVINVVEFDTLLLGPIGPPTGQSIPAPYPIYLPPNKMFTLQIYLQPQNGKPRIHVVDTTWHVRKDSLYDYINILDTTAHYKSLYQLTINKPNNLKP